MQKTVLSLEHLFFSYDETMILEDVSLSVNHGEFIGIFGPNGGGKTTLLKLILGFLKPKRGKLHLFNQSPEKSRHHIGYVPQAVRFDRDFPISAVEVVMMGCLSSLSIWGNYPKGTKEKALEALKKVGLEHKAAFAFGTLSGGEAQRVLIARAIVNQPELLILDEPTASVDPKAEEAIYELLVQLNREMTILMVTHDLQTIVDKVGRLLCVHRKVTSLKTKEVCEHFALGLYHTPLTTQDHFTSLGS